LGVLTRKMRLGTFCASYELFVQRLATLRKSGGGNKNVVIS